MANPTNTADFLDLVKRSGIFTPDSLDQALEGIELPDDAVKSAAMLVRQGVLSQFQAKLLLNGKYRGFKLGPYVIKDQIGQGGMGTVYLAEHGQLRRKVAVKVLAQQDKAHQVAVERFLREARAAAALDHPNIVRIHDVGQHGEVHYLVMEYVDGQTLDQIVEKAGPIACGRAVEYMTQSAAGLQHAFEKGFVHRDIKPGNLMLAKDGTVKILDMGLARSFEANDKLTEILDKGAVVGTADYISPEQAMNAADLDIRADIYSLGATFFTLVTGRPPFEGTTTQKLLQHQMKQPPTLATLDRTFPAGLSEVVAKMLAKKPSDRYRTPADVIAALAPWLPNSARLAESISRTNLKPDLRNTLNEVVSGRTRDLSKPATEPTPKRIPPMALAGGGGVLMALLLVGGLYATGVFGKSKPDAVTKREPAKPAATTPTAPPTETKGSPKVAEKPKEAPAGPLISSPLAPAPKEAGVVYALDLTGRRKYAEKGTVLGDPTRPGIKRIMSSTSGDGQLPPDWLPVSGVQDGAFQGAVDEVSGRLAVGAKAGTAGVPAVLLSPEVYFPSGKGTVKVEYLTDAKTGPYPVKIRPIKPRPGDAIAVGELAPTGGNWATAELKVDLKGGLSGRLELAAGKDPQNGVWVRGFTAHDPEPPAGKVVLRLNTASLKPFIQRTVRFTEPGSKVPLKEMSTTGPGKMPAGWYRWIEYPETTAEFFADGSPEAVALGLRAVAGPGGVQINSPEIATSGRCRVRLLYQTGPSSPGFLIRFRPTKPSTGPIFDIGTLPATGGSWRLVVLDVDQRGATGGLFEISNGTAGADAAVRLREFTVSDQAN